MTTDRTSELIKSLRARESSPQQVVITVEEEGQIDDEETCLTIQETKPTMKKAKRRNELDRVFRQVSEIKMIIDKMQDCVASLRTFHIKMQQAARADSGFSDECENLTENFKCSGLEAKSKIKDLNKLKTTDAESAINRIIRTQMDLQQRILQDTVQDFQKCLEDHKNRHETIIRKQLKIANVQVSDEELLTMLDSPDPAIFVEDHIKETLEAVQALHDTEVKHKEILAIEKAIKDIQDMFIEMALQLYEQGETVDKIDNHTEKGLHATERGQKKVSKAEKKSQKVRKKKLYLAGIVTLVIMIFLLLSIILA